MEVTFCFLSPLYVAPPNCEINSLAGAIINAPVPPSSSNPHGRYGNSKGS